MKSLIREIRLYIVVKLIGWAFDICPNDAPKTKAWFTELPFEK